ncbi:uncharacterized protein E6C27_scaffold288G001770 [Cucumis melo var. makuwa]|uniref:Uncharacterized protein n=2 Tax=Cucumis melo TaxID=3656 RepID=A0A5A7UQQ8_CUCMM|nr:uncharacterized protein LOC127150248 [Cucumis melo]KAA0056646.1 uncharacterized protein E6C27_scaffold288G001770 [Cucumis melo var. makuwa]
MGGCASKPKGMDLHPTEVPTTPTNEPQPQSQPKATETITQGNNDGGENASTTLVDLSKSFEPKQDEAVGDVKLKSAPRVSNYDKSTTPNLTHDEKVEGIAKETEDKNEAIVQNTQTKEGHPRTTFGADAAKSDATPTPTSEHKTMAPLDVAI